MIQFVCDGCGQQLKIGDEWSGKLGHCPYCGTNSRVPGYPRRTPKWKILARLLAAPFIVGLGYFLLFSIVDVWAGVYFLMGGMIWCVVMLGFCWVVTNVGTFLSCPREYRLWKKGGGDPWFDTLDPPFNNDPPSVRYFELYREKERMENEAIFGPPPPPPPDPSDRRMDDPNFL